MCGCVYMCMCACMCVTYEYSHVTVYSGTSLLRTFWDLNFSPYYRGVLNSEVTNTLQYYTETQNGVLITAVSTF